MFEPRDFFFGLLRVNQWGYDWGYSNAFIELMCMDTTIIDYGDNKTNKTADRQSKADEAIRAYYEKKKQQKVQFKLD